VKKTSEKDKTNLNQTPGKKEKSVAVISDESEPIMKNQENQVQANGTKDNSYVPVFDTDTSKYIVYSEKDLLTKKNKDLETMNEKVEESGHMIDYRAKQKADIQKSDDDNIYGFILLAAAIIGIALLLSSLILRKNKEAGE
jgi:Tfp pilus assembly protein FimT